jgi:hypothetical protein
MAGSIMEPKGDLPAIKRDAKGKILPGQRALNPSGLDRQKQRMLNQLNQLTPRAISKLSKLIDSDSDQVSLAACREVLDRNLGKPKASLDVKVEASLSAMHLEALEQLAHRASEARASRMIDVTPEPAAKATPSMIDTIDYSDDKA